MMARERGMVPDQTASNGFLRRPFASASAFSDAAAPVARARQLADPEAVRAAHRRFPTGVTVVTAAVDGTPHGLAVNAFASVALEPSLVLVCVARRAATYGKLFLSDHIGVNILAGDQRAIAERFARSGGDKFAGLAWRPGSCGAPLLDGVAARMELEIVRRVPAYTHTVFVGAVLRAEAFARPPLLYIAGELLDSSTLRSPAPDGGSATP